MEPSCQPVSNLFTGNGGLLQRRGAALSLRARPPQRLAHGKLATGHFLSHVQQELAVILVRFAQETAKLPQIPRVLAGTAPTTFVSGLSLEQIRHLRRFFAVVKELIKWDLESASHFLQCFNGGNGMTVFHPRNVAPEQARALFDVTLGEILFFAEYAKAIANNHGGIVSLGKLPCK